MVKKRWNKKTYNFQLITLIFLTILLLFNFIVLGIYNYLDIYHKATMPNKDNLIWTFTQFTWWSTILYWVVLVLRFVFLKRFLNNWLIDFLYEETISLFLAAYLTVVGLLFWSGTAMLYFRKTTIKETTTLLHFKYYTSLRVADFIKTIMVHFVTPILCIKMFIMYNHTKKKTKYKYSYLANISWGMIYPAVYIIFYVIFTLSKYGYDPYPITNLKKWEGVHALPITFISFVGSICLYTYIANRHLKSIMNNIYNKLKDINDGIIKKISHDKKNILMYAIGESTSDTAKIIKEIYKFDLDPRYINKITNKLLHKIENFKTRRLDKIYPMVFIDEIRFKTSKEGVSKEVSIYIIIGYTMEGKKEVLAYSIGESNASKYWLTAFNDLKSRGLEQILIISCDNLSGISNAINANYPETNVQKYIVQQITKSVRSVNYKHKKEFVEYIIKICKSSSLEDAKIALNAFEERWEKEYACVVKSWRENFGELITFFEFPHEIRKLIYTTNTIESFDKKLKKVTKNKNFPNLNSLSKIVYLLIQEQHKKWNQSIDNWNSIHNQLAIFFDLKI